MIPRIEAAASERTSEPFLSPSLIYKRAHTKHEIMVVPDMPVERKRHDAVIICFAVDSVPLADSMWHKRVALTRCSLYVLKLPPIDRRKQMSWFADLAAIERDAMLGHPVLRWSTFDER